MKVRVIPVRGGVFRPGGGLLPKRGAVVEVDSYWARREADGSVRFEDVAPATKGPSSAAVEGPTPSAKGPARVEASPPAPAPVPEAAKAEAPSKMPAKGKGSSK